MCRCEGRGGWCVLGVRGGEGVNVGLVVWEGEGGVLCK